MRDTKKPLKPADTIAAIATANGLGAISIVRLSGENALKIALSLTRAKKLAPRHAHLMKIYDENGAFLDEAIVLFFKAPKSFTGEDVVEFQTHGGFAVASLLLETLIKKGVRLARAGEFSQRALINGKMSLFKALNTAQLINAKSEGAAKIIARNLEGRLGELLEKMRIDLVKTLAHVETSIDYAEDDLPLNLLENIAKMCEQNAQDLQQIAQISRSKKSLIQGFKIAIIGKPNAGKSSLLNAFLNKKRAIVSNEAGTTRDTIEESLKIGTHLVRIIDTAGIRDAKNEIEKEGIALSKKTLEEADIIIALFDNSREKDGEDREILRLVKPYLKDFEQGKLKAKKENSKANLNSNLNLSSNLNLNLNPNLSAQKKVFLVLNKSDLPSEFKIENEDFIKLSAKGDISVLLNALETYLNAQESVDFILPNLELIQGFENAATALMRAKNLLREQNLELFAFELNLALNEITKFTRSFDYDELLDSIFSEFCLGK